MPTAYGAEFRQDVVDAARKGGAEFFKMNVVMVVPVHEAADEAAGVVD